MENKVITYDIYKRWFNPTNLLDCSRLVARINQERESHPNNKEEVATQILADYLIEIVGLMDYVEGWYNETYGRTPGIIDEEPELTEFDLYYSKQLTKKGYYDCGVSYVSQHLNGLWVMPIIVENAIEIIQGNMPAPIEKDCHYFLGKDTLTGLEQIDLMKYVDFCTLFIVKNLT